MTNVDDLLGTQRLLADAVVATTDLVEAVHASVLAWPRRIAGLPPRRHTSGIPGLAYSGIRGIARLAGKGSERVLQQRRGMDVEAAPTPRREALVAALNGIAGDYLEASGNPLAVQARLRRHGRALLLERGALAETFPAAGPRVLLMVHGLCMNDLQWRHRGHDHGIAISRELGYDLVHLHYNSGLPVRTNGRRLSALLQRLVAAWPVAIERISIVGHSMGGLVARAAIDAAREEESDWLSRLDTVVSLGTPYQGAPLERAGHALERLLGASAHTRPFQALGRMRSAGIRDLRQGCAEASLALPPHVRACVVAGSLQQQAAAGRRSRRPRGDGLVPVASALGEHPDPRRRLQVADERKLLVHATGHIALLGSADVHARLREWLS